VERQLIRDESPVSNASAGDPKALCEKVGIGFPQEAMQR
jgi:hypothetical protein